MNRQKKHIGLIICLIWLGIGSSYTKVLAQTACSLALAEANKDYQIGSFDQVIVLLTPCIQNGFSTREKIQAYQLLAKTYLATDYFIEAADAVKQLLKLDENYEPNLFDPPQFSKLVREVKRGQFRVKVVSVSKKSESLMEAPATVYLVTAKQIKNRGYLDLETIFHDLPGFDITRQSGVIYSNIFQRGYRSNSTNRTLFLFDGLEDNGLWTGTAYISRQIPLSNVKNVEVVYGPASTMYGSNAFLGVVNVITYDPEEITGTERHVGVRANTGYGNWNSRFIDATVAARFTNVSMSLTARVFKSDQMDLSKYREWDYDRVAEVDSYYTKMVLKDTAARNFARSNKLHPEYYEVQTNSAGDTVRVAPTETGVQRAMDLDNTAFSQITGKVPRYSNNADDWSIMGKIKFAGFLLGFQTYTAREGTGPTYTDKRSVGTDEGNYWVPRSYSLYLKFDRPISDNITLTSLSNYKIHDLAGDTAIRFISSYESGGLKINHLVKDSLFTFTTRSQNYYYYYNTQLRSEFKVLYSPSNKLDVVTGFEYRSSLYQRDYLYGSKENPQYESWASDSLEFNQALDIGAYSQTAYRPTDHLKITLGGRLDYNAVQDTLGYGTVFNPRIAVVYSPGKFIFKGIYAEAFKDQESITKYTTSAIRPIANPTLQPEKAKNLEGGIAYQHTKDLAVDLSLYYATYSDIASDKRQSNGTQKFVASGKIRVTGLQANLYYKRTERFSAFANYTFTDPTNTIETPDGRDSMEVRVGDIADHQIKMGANYEVKKDIELNLRMNYVGAKKTGKETSVSDNPLSKIDAYLIFNGAITYSNILPGITGQLVINNILDSEYFHPGPRSADGVLYPAQIPQNSRQVVARLFYEF